MLRKLWLPLLAVLLLAGTAPVRGQDVKDVLGMIPADSMGFAIFNSLDQINDKTMAAAKKLHLPLPASPLDLAKTIGVTKGLNTKGSAAAVFLPADGPPVGVLLLPVSDYPEFIGQFNAKGKDIVDITVVDKKFAVASKGKFAVMVHSEHKNELKSFLTAKTKAASWTMPLTAWLDSNDITFVATPLGIKKGISAMGEGIAKFKEIAGGNDQIAFMKGMVEGLEECLKTTEAELTHAALGTRVDKAGNLILDARGLFAKGGSLAKSAANLKPLPGGPLANLPSGPFAMALGGSVPQGFMDSMMKFTVELIKLGAKQMGGEVSKETMLKLEKSYTSMYKGMASMSYVVRTGKGNTGLMGGTVVSITTASSAGYLASYEKMVPITNALYKDLNLPNLPTTKVTRKKVGKVNVLEATADLSGFNDDPMQKKIMDAMYGKGGKMTYSQAALNGKTVLAGFTSAQGLQALMQGLQKGSLKDDPDVARTLGLLPKDSQWLLLVSPQGATKMSRQMIDAFAPGAPVQIPNFPPTPPVGIGASLSESGIILQIVVPGPVIDGIGRLVAGGDA